MKERKERKEKERDEERNNRKDGRKKGQIVPFLSKQTSINESLREQEVKTPF